MANDSKAVPVFMPFNGGAPLNGDGGQGHIEEVNEGADRKQGTSFRKSFRGAGSPLSFSPVRASTEDELMINFPD